MVSSNIQMQWLIFILFVIIATLINSYINAFKSYNLTAD